jgi:MFS family permease
VAAQSIAAPAAIRLGLRANLGQFVLLVVINALVGAMVGMERALLPLLAEDEFHLKAHTAILSFILVFGLAKAATNYATGMLSRRFGRRPLLLAGWLLALPVPWLLIWAPSWRWILAANALLGISQGLCWSTTVIMKIDLAGPAQRGLAMGLNEFAGYLALSVSAVASSHLAQVYGLRPQPFLLGAFVAVAGLLLSLLAAETLVHTDHEASLVGPGTGSARSERDVFLDTTFRHPDLSSVTQAGLVNNLNDGMAWGLFPLLFASVGLGLREVGWLVALYPAVWGIGQVVVGPLSDRWGRKGFIVGGMWIQAAGIALIAAGHGLPAFITGSVLLGIGTAMVYPTLLAAIGDVAHPVWRASAVGTYRMWRDLGYAAGAVLAGLLADGLGLRTAIAATAAITFASGIVAALRMERRAA